MTRDEIISVSKTEGGMFIVIPSVVKMDGELPLSAQMLYGIITWKCNSYAYTWATNRELSEALGVSAKRVSALLALLEKRGHIETEIEYREGTNEIVRRCIYPVMRSTRHIVKPTPHPENEDTPLLKNKDTSPREHGDLSPGMGIPLPENAEVICNINKQKENKNNTPCSPPAGDEPAGKEKSGKSEPKYKPPTFDYFWQLYPKKKSRQAAVRAWDKLKPDLELCRIMNAALRRDINSPEWAKQDGQYIPHFSTWLNQRRWEDEGVDLSLLPQTQNAGGGWADAPGVDP